MKAIKLTDLIENGRRARTGERPAPGVMYASDELVAPGLAALPPPLGRSHASHSRPARKALPFLAGRMEELPASSAIVDGLEDLTVELLSLLRARRDNPRRLMVEALQSIDECLVAIREGR